ncbi:serpin family protein [bacterium]|nr:MAG: serpin family protein [bacterium]
MILPTLLLAFTAAPDFATRLWQAVPTGNGNVVVSPASVEACLGLLIPAVGPSSKPALAKTLGTSVPGLSALWTNLLSRQKAWTVSGEVTVANAGFFSETPRPTYVAALKAYGGTADRLRSLQQVNGWVEKKTKGRIPKLFERLDPQTHAVLVNAITFEGDWQSAFDKKLTRKEGFQTPSGQRGVGMMHSPNLNGFYAEGKGYRAVELPYKAGRYRMVVMLPNDGDPAAIFKDSDWKDVVARQSSIDLSLPRFNVRSKPDVEKALMSMGLAPLFGRIDLSPALPGGANDNIDQIVHQTWIKVDEKGTEAAAATGIAMTKGAPMQSRKVVFRVDRPFAFAIRNEATGEILFQGVVREP